VELAADSSACPSGGLTLATISAVFTIVHVAATLGEDEDWLRELSIDVFPEHGRMHVYGLGEEGITALTKDEIEWLKHIVAMERAAGRAPPKPTAAK
jgi:hypothetical protein